MAKGYKYPERALQWRRPSQRFLFATSAFSFSIVRVLPGGCNGADLEKDPLSLGLSLLQRERYLLSASCRPCLPSVDQEGLVPITELQIICDAASRGRTAIPILWILRSAARAPPRTVQHTKESQMEKNRTKTFLRQHRTLFLNSSEILSLWIFIKTFGNFPPWILLIRQSLSKN